MEIVKFAPSHLELLMLQPAQEHVRPLFGNPEYGKSLAQGKSFTAAENGFVYGCGGIVEMWDNRAMAWALLSHEAGKKFTLIHRAVMRFFDTVEHRRIEIAVDTDFAEAHRWAKLLGFTFEGTMKAYTPDGRDCDLYAKVRA